VPINLTYYASSVFTVRCLAGEGPSVSAFASAESIISQRDADRKALGAARARAQAELACLFPAPPDQPRYFNAARSASGSCPLGTASPSGPFDPSATFEAQVPAGSVYSLNSVEEANTAAEALAQAELAALLSLKCSPYWENTEQSYTASCGFGQAGSPITAIVAAGTVVSFSSQLVADTQALAQAQQQAIDDLVCVTAVFNTAQSFTASCPSPPYGPSVTVLVSSGSFSAATLEEANDLALAFATSQATAALVCNDLYTNTEQSFTADCESEYGEGWFGSDVTITVPAGSYFSSVSQEEADQLALDAATSEAVSQLACSYF
jgi:hypothetical protein